MDHLYFTDLTNLPRRQQSQRKSKSKVKNMSLRDEVDEIDEFAGSDIDADPVWIPNNQQQVDHFISLHLQNQKKKKKIIQKKSIKI